MERKATSPTQPGSALPRPRATAWGSFQDRAVLQALAEDVSRRSGFRVCAIEVIRADQMLEFVAIAGSPDGSERLMGQGSPLDSMQIVFDSGIDMGAWTFVAGDELGADTREILAEYGHQPELEVLDVPGAWLAEDMLFSRLRGMHGVLRAVLYLDEPLNGMRPSAADIDRIHREVQVALESVTSIVERDAFGEQVRMAEAARKVIQSARSKVSEAELIEMVRTELPVGLRAERVEIILAGQLVAKWEHFRDGLTTLMKNLWRTRGQLVIERDRVWAGDVLLEGPLADGIQEIVEGQGLGAWVLIPFGLGDDYLGALVLGRQTDRPRWTDSEVMGARAVSLDIASAIFDARSMEREVQLNTELRALDTYRREMLGTLAHELQNPVGVLMGHLDLVSMIETNPRSDRSLAAMERATARIDAMAQDLMALSKVTDSERALVELPVNMSALVSEVLDYVGVLADAAGVRLVGEVAPGLLVPGDVEELHRVASNLVSNAIKYTPSGGSVTITLEGADGCVRLTCADTGLGIAESELPQLYTPFFRSRDAAAREKPGTGLGLAIVHQIVVRHRGTIAVESALGRGTTFVVSLPQH